MFAATTMIYSIASESGLKLLIYPSLADYWIAPVNIFTRKSSHFSN